MLRQSLIRWAIGFAAALAASVALAQTTNHSDFDRAAAEGQALGESLKRSTQVPQVQAGGENGAGRIIIPGDSPLDVNLIVPGASAQQRSQLESLNGDVQAQEAAAQVETERRLEDASSSGDAYRTLRNDSYRAADDDASVQGDQQLWAQTLSVLSGTDPISAEFPDCETSVDLEYGPGRMASAVTQRTCEQINVLDACERRREVVVEQTQVTVADLVNEAFSADTALSFPLSAVLPNATAPTQAQATLVWTGTIAGAAITQQPGADNGWTVVVTIDVADAGELPQLANLSVTASVDSLSESISSAPENCLDASDGWCEARWTCTDNEPRTIGGVQVDSGLGLAALYPDAAGNVPPSSTTPVCYAAHASYDCGYNLGAMPCWDSPLGRQCHTNTEQNTQASTCVALEHDPQCALVRSECVENAHGHQAFCYVENRVYECRDDTMIPGIAPRIRNSCGAGVRCLGDDCAKQTTEQQQDISKTMTTLMLVQHAKSDYAVDSENGQPVAKAFPGQPLTCRKSLGGSVDCCTETDTDAMQRWVALYSEHERQGNANAAKLRVARSDQAGTGAWDELRDARNWNRDTVQSPLTSRMDTITAGTAGGADVNGEIGSGTQLSTVNAQIEREARTQTMPQLGWTCRADEFELAHRKELGQCTSIGSYCEATVLGQCITKIDTYCCWSSPISRAVRETAAGGHPGIKLGAFGTPRHPQCEGVTYSQLSQIPWGSVALDDMAARLQQAGALPTPESLVARTSTARLTGEGSTLGDPARPDVLERTAARLQPVPFAEVNSAVGAQAASLTPGAASQPANGGVVVFSPAYTYGRAGTRIQLTLSREGTGVGTASVGFATRDATARAGTDYEAASGIVAWADGEVGSKLIEVATTARATNERRFLEVALSDASGASLGPSPTAHVEILGGHGATVEPAPPTPGYVTLSKTASGAPGGHVRIGNGFTWRVRMSNGMTTALPRARVVDELPEQLGHGGFVRDVLCSIGTAGRSVAGNRLTVWCDAPTSGLAAGQSLEMRIHMQNMPEGVFTNRCSADTGGAPINGDCSNTVVVSDAASPPPPAGCPAPPEGFTRDARYQRFTDVRTLNWPDIFIRDFPESGSPLGLLTMDYGRYASIAFTAPADPAAYEGLERAISWYEAQIGGEAIMHMVYSSFSPCPADFRIPTNDVAPLNDPTLRNACRNLQFNASGQVTQTSLGIGYTVSGEPNRCPITPGLTYYWNFILADPRDGFDILTDNPCNTGSPDHCGIEFKIR